MPNDDTVLEAVENTLRAQPRPRRRRRKLAGVQRRSQTKAPTTAKRPKYKAYDPDEDLTEGQVAARDIGSAVAETLASTAPRTRPGRILARVAEGVHGGAKVGEAVAKYRTRRRRKRSMTEQAMEEKDRNERKV
jgi:hypothetical protein